MNKVFLFAFLQILGIAAYAQRVAMPSTPTTDSIKAVRLSKNQVQDVDGIKMGTGLDIPENLRRAPQFSLLFNALQKANLRETFKSRGPITLFAPTNEAFAQLPRSTLDTLMKPKHQLELSALICCQAVNGRFTVKEIIKKIRQHHGTATFTSIGGSKIVAHADSNGGIILVDETGKQASIKTADLKQSNGIIHATSAFLMPKAKANI